MLDGVVQEHFMYLFLFLRESEDLVIGNSYSFKEFNICLALSLLGFNSKDFL